MVWDDAKREAARQRMLKARAVMEANRAKKQQASLTATAVAERSSSSPTTAFVTSDVDLQPDLVLTVRRLHVGSFAGLWELCRINPDGSKTVVTDANTKALIINLARNEILKCGQ